MFFGSMRWLFSQPQPPLHGLRVAKGARRSSSSGSKLKQWQHQQQLHAASSMDPKFENAYYARALCFCFCSVVATTVASGRFLLLVLFIIFIGGLFHVT